MPRASKHPLNKLRLVGMAILVAGGLATVSLLVAAFFAPLHEGIYEFCARLTPATISIDDVYRYRPRGIISIVPLGMGCTFETSTGATLTVLPGWGTTWPFLIAVLVVIAGITALVKSRRKPAVPSVDVDQE